LTVPLISITLKAVTEGLAVLSDELIRELRRLSRTDKLRAIQILANDLVAAEEEYFTSGAEYAVWSPYDAADAAEKLMALLEEEKKRNG
jgi:hypothetical protein